MLHFQLVSLMALSVTSDCQVIFKDSPKPPSDISKTSSSNKNHQDCTASNGQQGSCYEFRSDEFKNCSFYQSTDTSNPEVSSHLTQNKCKNDGFQIYFCCPFDRSQLDAVIPKKEDCGTSTRNNVVGGTITFEGDWPWLASIGYKDSEGYNSYCGGTLITKQHVISAAHCFTPENKAKYPNSFVRLGEYNLVDDADEAQDYDIIDERVHEYNTVTKENDIILLKLERPVSAFTDSLRPACLPYHLRNEKFIGEKLFVVGWGRHNNSKIQGAPVPYEGLVPVVPISECREKYQLTNTNRKIDDKQLCAGTGGTDSCHGDSGGPINYLDSDPDKNRFYVVGVVSFGPNFCGSDSHPGVYARIGYYLDWIEENLLQLL